MSDDPQLVPGPNHVDIVYVLRIGAKEIRVSHDQAAKIHDCLRKIFSSPVAQPDPIGVCRFPEDKGTSNAWVGKYEVRNF